jgi:hypothetical protein
MGFTRAVKDMFHNLMSGGPSASVSALVSASAPAPAPVPASAPVPTMSCVLASDKAPPARKPTRIPVSRIDPRKDVDWITVRRLAIGLLVMDGRSLPGANTVLRRISGDLSVAKRLYDAARRGDCELELAQRLVRAADEAQTGLPSGLIQNVAVS